MKRSIIIGLEGLYIPINSKLDNANYSLVQMMRGEPVSKTSRNRAFTMLEVLSVIGIIVVLVGMLLLGASHMLGSSKEKSTKVMLAALQGMLAEYDTQTHLSRSPAKWRWYDTSSALSQAADTANGIDFWKRPFKSSQTGRDIDALDAPGLVTEGSPDGVDERSRNASRQVLNTQLAMRLILGIPHNRSALDRLAADRLFIPHWKGGGLKVPAPGLDGVLEGPQATLTDDTTDDIWYEAGMQIQDDSGQRWVCVNGGVAAVPPGPGPWQIDKSPPSPLLLDAWNNPIIIVPGSGLRVRLLNGATDYNASTVQTAIIMSPEGKANNAVTPPTVLQVGRPFFASAGADGDFSKGDDNIYSFEP